jgi:hypothetical protein
MSHSRRLIIALGLVGLLLLSVSATAAKALAGGSSHGGRLRFAAHLCGGRCLRDVRAASFWRGFGATESCLEC